MRVLNSEAFLEERKSWRQMVEANRQPNDIVVDPGDEIICDSCNDNIEGLIYLDSWGARCLNCQKESVAYDLANLKRIIRHRTETSVSTSEDLDWLIMKVKESLE